MPSLDFRRPLSCEEQTMRFPSPFRRLAATPVRRRRPAPPRVEALEDRAVPATFFATNANDSGLGSLRQAILNSNATPGPNQIFVVPGASKILLSSGELQITNDVTI